MGEVTTLDLEMRELRAKNDVLERQLSVALRDNQLLRARLEAELRRHLGSKADKIDPNQLEIPFEELVDAVLADSEPEPAAAVQEASDAEEAPAASSALSTTSSGAPDGATLSRSESSNRVKS